VKILLPRIGWNEERVRYIPTAANETGALRNKLLSFQRSLTALQKAS
jgi:coenzyme F420-reducing hydrogenase delta subunit